MTGEHNLQKIKEVGEYFYLKKKKKKKTIINNFYSPKAIKRIHEFINDAPDIVMSEELPYMTGTNVDKMWNRE